jgi:hypothetical protein
LAKDQNPFRITAKFSDVVTYPSQGQNKVQLTYIARIRKLRAADLCKVEVAEGVQPVVQGYDYHIPAAAEIDPVVYVKIGRVSDKAAAMHINHHRPLCAVSQAGSPYVQVKAILADRTSRISD